VRDLEGYPPLSKGARLMARGRTLAGARHRYDVVLLRTHAEVLIRGNYGKGPVRAVAKVDREDVDLVRQYAWHLAWTQGAPAVETDMARKFGTRVHLTLQGVLFPTPDGRGAGFRNGDTMDFRKANLILGGVVRRPIRGSRSGVRGVSWNAQAGRWYASVGKTHLGSFDSIEEAGAAALAERARRGWGERAIAIEEGGDAEA